MLQHQPRGSPGISAGRGLKLKRKTNQLRIHPGSPGISAGRGLKLVDRQLSVEGHLDRPALVPGVD